MNLGLHVLFLQVIVSIVQFQHGFRLCSAGEPGYLDFDNLPETNFSCQGKVIGGYYADVEAGCQMFHVCTIGQKDEIMDIKFLCLNGTVFDQETRVCERVDEVDCSKSERFYNLNLELYGNHAVTLSLHESGTDDEDEQSEPIDEHESQRTTSARPSTTSATTTTTQRPSVSSTTSASGSYQHPNGYPQHYQPQPRFPPVQTSQSKSLYDDKNGGYHHQYIYHTGDHRTNNLDHNNDGNGNGNNNNNEHHDNNNDNDNNQATSYQLFSNQGVSSTTGVPQVHQIRYSSTPATQIQIRNDHQPTVSPIFHTTSSTIQTLLNSNANSPALINPIFHSHGIASTTEQFTVHNNNPRETDEYGDDDEPDHRDDGRRDHDHDDRRPLEAIQPTTQGKISKLTISPITNQNGNDRSGNAGKNNQQQRIAGSFLPTPSSDDGQAVRSFYPTPRTSTKSSSSHVTHIHLPPPPSIPQLKPHQITINLPSPDIQRIVQNPSPLLPSQSRVIVTAKASVSDESGRALNTTQLVTIPLPTIPASYDDYKEGDESFDPFYRDVPKIRNDRRAGGRFRWPVRDAREKRSQRTRRDVVGSDGMEDMKIVERTGVLGENLTEETTNATMMTEKNEAEVSRIVSEDIEDREIAKDDSQTIGEESKYTKIENDETERERIEEKEFDEKKQKLTKDSEDVENEKMKGEDDLKTMSSSHHSDSDENVEKESPIDTADSDVDEHVETIDTGSKSTVGSERAEKGANASSETFDSKIFDEPESQTSKEVDTRAVAQHDTKYSKDRDNGFGKEKINSNRENSNDLETRKQNSADESARFSLLPEVVDFGKSHRKHSKKSGAKERFSAEIEREEDEEDDEEFLDRRKSHRKHSSKNSKLRERVTAEDDEEESDDEEEEEFVAPRKSHRKHSSKKSKSRGRAPVVDDEDEEEAEEIVSRRKSHRKHLSKKTRLREEPSSEEVDQEDEDYEEEIFPRKSHRKHSAKKSRLRERYPAEDEEAEDYEDIVDRRKSRGKHSSRKSKSKKRLPSEEEDEEDDQYRDVSSERFDDERDGYRGRDIPENYDYYDTEMDSSSVRGNEEDSADYSRESSNKLKASRNRKTSRRDKSFKFTDDETREDTSRRDKDRKFEEENGEEDDYDFYDASTTQSNEEVTSVEMDGDYEDDGRTAVNTEDSREIRDDSEEMLRDGTTTNASSEPSEEIASSTEKLDSPDEATSRRDKNSHGDDERDSEGVLKFTDEIPSSDKMEEPLQVESSKSADEIPQDYIDDNYEPQSYKEHGQSSTSTEAGVTVKNVEKEATTLSTVGEKHGDEIVTTETTTAATEMNGMEEQQNDQAYFGKNLPEIDAKIEKSMELPIEDEKAEGSTPSTSTTTTTTTTPTTTTTTTTSTTSTTTAKPTTARPTPPKLFKPFTMRKSYVYIPPTTTPVPVIIKPRLSLLNPKPAKPPKSYNELAPKPIIRKSSLYARKPTIRTTTLDNRETTTELPFVTTNNSILEETASSTIVLSPTIAEVPPASSPSSITLIASRDDKNSSYNEDYAPMSTMDNFELIPTTEAHTVAPHPLPTKISQEPLMEKLQALPEVTKENISMTDSGDMENNNVPSLGERDIYTTTTMNDLATLVPEESSSAEPSATEIPEMLEMPKIVTTSDSSGLDNNAATISPKLEIPFSSTIQAAEESATMNPEISTTLKDALINNAPTLASIRAVNRRPGTIKRTAFFNCLEKEMYRFYADGRDCRLFHYCSPGFTSRQVLDFRFVCEEGTTFDEDTQSCIHEVTSPKCRQRVW